MQTDCSYQVTVDIHSFADSTVSQELWQYQKQFLKFYGKFFSGTLQNRQLKN